jgi:hypothetical protein
MKGVNLYLVFRHLSPRDLVTCMLLNKESCKYARLDLVWKRHKDCVLNEIPQLFESEWTEPIWLVFVKKLLGGRRFFKNAIVRKDKTFLERIIKYVLRSEPKIRVEVDFREAKCYCSLTYVHYDDYTIRISTIGEIGLDQDIVGS